MKGLHPSQYVLVSTADHQAKTFLNKMRIKEEKLRLLLFVQLTELPELALKIEFPPKKTQCAPKYFPLCDIYGGN